tara:strand:- start:2209 stop:2334 length:126 start_codon:yes stop_codon:yes gene_type:complete
MISKISFKLIKKNENISNIVFSKILKYKYFSKGVKIKEIII